tara:strand:- start:232 stop:612 length:381 start_codon:yes stop_codon:yes gene_type:complete
MGIKRRSMFNPKFKASRPKRWEMGQDKLTKRTPDNSEVIEILNQELPQDKTHTTNIVEEMIQETQELIADVKLSEHTVDIPIYKTSELKKMKKAKLLEIANSTNCEVNNNNTKAQIIAAIEKQSAS